MFKVMKYEHVGIRVTDRARAVAFYETLGWREETDLPDNIANEMVNDAGVHINLIFNGVARDENRNILQDEAIKYPGVTHPAFVIENMDALLATFARAGIRVTQGPEIIAGRRKACFIRDPDGTVLEFDEMLPNQRHTQSTP
ncbi:MAG: VOC family protein [Acidiphilium sp.]|nr:VOC family protein [Acidiphilium sp.]MDD4936218.1 VOC family protein [Acidiphilium sp.]